MHADTSRPTATGRAEATTAAAIFPPPLPEAEATRSPCVGAQGTAGNLAPRGVGPERLRPAPAAAMASAAVESFVAKQLDLLELERDAEVEERRCGRRASPRARPALLGRGAPCGPSPAAALGPGAPRPPAGEARSPPGAARPGPGR